MKRASQKQKRELLCVKSRVFFAGYIKIQAVNPSYCAYARINK